MHCCRVPCGVAPGSGSGADLPDQFRSPRYPRLEPTLELEKPRILACAGGYDRRYTAAAPFPVHPLCT